LWINLLNFTLIIGEEVLYTKLQGSGWWPAQVYKRYDPMKRGRMLSSSSGSLLMLSKSWNKNHINVSLFGDEGLLSISISKKQFLTASFISKSKNLKAVQGKVRIRSVITFISLY
jgi:hypothetical protein